MVKIHILGGPGSGKTTLGEELSARFHVPHYEFDHFNVHDALAIAKQPAWITEAIHLVTIEPMLYQADYIVFLEVPWYVGVWRVIRRHIVKTLNRTNIYPTKLLFNFVRNTYSYYVDVDPVAEAFVRQDLEEYRERMETADADLLQMRVEKYMRATPLTADLTRLYLERWKEKVLFIGNQVDREHLFELLTQLQPTM